MSIESHFAESSPLSLGIEEEIMILDGESLMPSPQVATLVDAGAAMELPGMLKTELHASVVELNTGVCADASEALGAIGQLRRAAAQVAADNGLRIAAAGAHPLAGPEDLEIVEESRYLEFVEYAGVSARRQGVNGLHVHVGMPGPEECVHVLENILPWLPLVLALSANSPYLNGEETGHLSFRAEILGLLPRRGAPPRFESYADWERFIERLVHAGVIADYTQIWWDARVHPRFGTLEIRAPDQPTWLRHTAAFTALLQTLCAYALSVPRRDDGPGSRAVYDQNRWAASRYGTQAELVHPDEDRMVSVPELAEELLERLRPAAHKLGNDDLLSEIVPTRCEAERQLEIGRERGLESLLEALTERTLAFD